MHRSWWRSVPEVDSPIKQLARLSGVWVAQKRQCRASNLNFDPYGSLCCSVLRFRHRELRSKDPLLMTQVYLLRRASRLSQPRILTSYQHPTSVDRRDLSYINELKVRFKVLIFISLVSHISLQPVSSPHRPKYHQNAQEHRRQVQ
jgi:hypothetical protein